jgi:hypothetical protein
MNAAHRENMTMTHAIAQMKFRTLTTSVVGVRSLDSDLGKRQLCLNELGAEGWQLASTIISGTTIIDTFQQSISNSIPI